MTSVCQFFGTFNRTTFYDEECQFIPSTQSGGLTFVNDLLALMLLGKLRGRWSARCEEEEVEDYKREKDWCLTCEEYMERFYLANGSMVSGSKCEDDGDTHIQETTAVST